MNEPWRTVKGAGMKERHREWLVKCARDVALAFVTPTFVNIGIYYGASMHCLRKGAPNAMLWGVDIKDWGILHRELLGAYYLWEDSMECHRDFTLPVHLLFLDGIQTYEEVREDIRGWCPKVMPDGVVILNCYHLPPPRWGTKQAWDEWRQMAESEWELVKAPQPMQAFRRIL